MMTHGNERRNGNENIYLFIVSIPNDSRYANG
jgi:hypothetical protein